MMPPTDDRALRHLHSVAPHVAESARAAQSQEQANLALWGIAAQHSPVSMCLVGLDGTLWMPNEAFARMIGYTIGELQTMTFQELTYADDLQADLDLFHETLRGERSSYRLVKRYRRGDGGLVWADLSVALVRSEDDEPLHFIAQMLDVTTQRLDLERLASAVETAERERRLSEAILDTVDVGLVLVDRDGGYERVNRRQRDILAMAYPHGDLGADGELGHLFAADAATRLPDEQMPTARALRGEEFDDCRIWVGDDPATRRALSVSARTVLDASGRCSGAALAFSDVTDLVRALQARDVFESSVSHELRTPLTTVVGHLELLLEDSGLSDAAARQVRTVQRNANRLRYLVSDLLDPAARGQGEVTLACAPTDLTALVAESGQTMAAAARQAGLTLTVAAQAPVPVVVDADRVRQVVENLVSNAVKYTDPGGTVDLSVEVAEDTVAVVVSDTGIGIATEDVEHLFDPFFRAGQARDRMAPGLGLGLGIARAIAVAHGGGIQITSTAGKGSSFRITLPLPVHPDPR